MSPGQKKDPGIPDAGIKKIKNALESGMLRQKKRKMPRIPGC
jgi:hypothetical protein